MLQEEIKIKCADCGRTFPFTVAEQEFYKEHGFVQPKRCRQCRNKRKEERRDNNGSN